MGIEKTEFEELVKLLAKAVGYGAPAATPAAPAGGDAAKSGGDSKANQIKEIDDLIKKTGELTGEETERHLKRINALMELNTLEAARNKEIGDKMALKQNLIALNKLEKDSVDVLERSELAANEINKEIMSMRQKRIDTSKDLQKANKDIVGGLEELNAAEEKAKERFESFAEGIAGHLGMMGSAQQGFLGNFMKMSKMMQSDQGMTQFANALGRTFGPANLVNSAVQTIIDSTLTMITALEGANAALAKSTGQGRRFGAEVEQLALSSIRLGIGADQVGAAYGTLTEATTEFNNLGPLQRQEVAFEVAGLERLGVSLEDASSSIQFFSHVAGMSATEASKVTTKISMMGTALGVSASKMSKDFNASLGTLAVYGAKSIDVFTGLAAAAKAAGVEASELLGIATQFDTFAGAAEATGKLNAILGSNLSATQMLTMTEEQRIETLIMSVQASGQSFASMDKFTQKAIAAAAGVTDMNQANKIFGMSVSKYRGYTEEMKRTAHTQEEMNQKIADVMPIAEKMKNAFLTLAIGLGPVIDALSSAIMWLGEFFEKHGEVIQMVTGILAIIMIVGKANALWGGFVGLLKKGLDFLRPTWGRFAKTAKDSAGDVTDAATEMSEGAGNALGNLAEGAGGAVEKMSEGVSSGIENLTDSAGGAVKELSESVGEGIENLADGVSGAGKELAEGMEESAPRVSNALTSLAEGAGNAIGKLGDAVVSIAPKIGNAVVGLAQALGNALAAFAKGAATAGPPGLIVAAVVFLLVLAFAALAAAVAPIVQSLVELAMAMLDNTEVLPKFVLSFLGMLYGMVPLLPVIGMLVWGLMGVGLAIAVIGAAIGELDLDKMEAFSTLTLGLGLIAGGDIAGAFEDAEAGVQNLIAAYNNMSAKVPVKVTSMIENIALITTGRAKDTMTGAVIEASVKEFKAEFENIMKPSFQIQLSLDGKEFNTTVKKVIHETSGGK